MIRFSTQDLFADYLRVRLENLVFSIENVLTQYEAVSEFLASISSNPAVVSCSPETILPFLKYCQSASACLQRSPSRLSLADFHNDSLRYCQIDLKENDTDYFTVFYLWSENNRMIGRFYNQTTDFENWDYQHTGVFMMNNSYNPTTLPWLSSSNGTFWTHQMEVSGSALIDEAELGAFTPIVEDGKLVGMSGISIAFDTIREVVVKARANAAIRYVVTRADQGVILEESLGVVRPVRVVDGLPVYPGLDELNNSKWSAVKAVLDNVSEGSVVEILMGDESYLTAWKAVVPRKRHETHSVFVLLSFDDKITGCYKTITLVICGEICVGMLGGFGVIRLLILNNATRVSKLNKQRQRAALGAIKPAVGDGVLSKAVRSIRQVQIEYADDIAVNHELDNVVQNLTVNRMHNFVVTRDTDCEFCSFLTPPEPKWPESNDVDPFKHWHATTFVRFRILIPSTFRPQDFVDSPKKMLVKLFISLIEASGLLFAEIDPDSLISWCLELVQNREMDYVRTAHFLHSIYQLLNGPFIHWLDVKYEVFALYCAALLSGIIVRTEFPDPESVIENRTATFVSHLIGGENQGCSTKIWIMRVVRELQRGWDNERQFALLGEARIRFQSPNFSVVENFTDRLLFMKSLLRLCAFCEFWDPDTVSITEKEGDEIETKLKIEIAKKVVLPWIQLFIPFNPLQEPSAGLARMLNLFGDDTLTSEMESESRTSTHSIEIND
jgi:hypothetical protein